ncbi:uncharacterized protein LOC125201169 isoform X2 [Salvia hispanica]|uniref:uncharacterized protein LOC125201169 isoform X2 n=1 Tax=Salvia hispanica TaxID=49212 RepID=UPI0020099DB8|nr:uncharacterized protein LOC125201169 isoform X2 [Salvia hispanica]
MEGMREIPISYYERASEAEKEKIKLVFENADINGDGKITHAEMNKVISLTEALFHKFDMNGDGCVDFNEFMCLYYLSGRKMSVRRCNDCHEILVGPYFACFLCLGRGDHTYDLCCSCYRRGAESSHEHSVEHMVDHHSLLSLFREQKAQNKKEMEEIREIAKALHQASSPEVQELATEFYQSLDSDGDDRVDLSEFLAFMKEEGYSYKKIPSLFDELDVDSNGTLDFFEVMTLIYIFKSGRPQCECCDKIIPGVFFSCTECFKNPKSSFDLCKDCYVKGSRDHKHGGRAQFLDSHTLLQAMRYPEIADMSGVTIHEEGNKSTNDIAPSNSKWRKRKAAFYALDAAVKFGSQYERAK